MQKKKKQALDFSKERTLLFLKAKGK